MSNNVQAIQDKWLKIYNILSSNIEIVNADIPTINNIHIYITGISIISDNYFEQVISLLDDIKELLDTIQSETDIISSDNLKNILRGKLQVLLSLLKHQSIESISILKQEIQELKVSREKEIGEQNENFTNLIQALQENINRTDLEMKNIHFIYDKEYKKLSLSLTFYNSFFVLSLLLLFLVSLDLFENTISLNISLLTSDLTNTNPLPIILSNLSLVITNFLIKLPFLLPFIWLSIFLSNRRAEIHRLQQEYLHKSTFAQSYLKYEEQIKNLPENKQGDLLATLLDKLIETVSFNPSTTLDKKANKDISLEDVYNCLEKERTHFEKIRDFFKKDSENKGG